MKLRKTVAMLTFAGGTSVLGAVGAPASQEDEFLLIRDEEGNPLYIADSAGQEVTFVYDGQGQLVTTIDQDEMITDWQELLAEASGGEQ